MRNATVATASYDSNATLYSCDTADMLCTNDLNIDAILPAITLASRLCESSRPSDANRPESCATDNDCAMERSISNPLFTDCTLLSGCTSVLNADDTLPEISDVCI
jgi:hypothetical protein